MSAASAKTQEPSMEEILASIRRIIADDQEGGRPEAPPPRQSRPAVVEAEDDQDEVLDLAQVAQPAKPAPSLELEHEDISFDDGQIDFDSIDIEEPEPEPEPEIEPELSPEPEMEAEEDEADAFMIMEEPAPAPRMEMQDRLLSATTDAAVGQAFNMLAHTVLSNNARTLEDLVKDMLKPMLKVWLDDNLPTMVERLVRAEIERVARGNR